MMFPPTTKLKFAALGVVCALLFIANNQRKQTPAYLLRGYPPSANLTYVIKHHVRPVNSVVFRSDWFDSNTTSAAMGCQIDQTGSKACQTYSENTTLNAGTSMLAPTQLARFQAALRALPPGETTAPPLQRLLIVSFRNRQNWTTRIYDRAHLPSQFAKVVKLGGFRGLQLRPADK